MKNFFFLFYIFIALSSTVYSQDSESPWAFELSTGKNEYRGDLANRYFKDAENFTGIAGLGINKGFFEVAATRYLSSDFDASFRISNGDYGYSLDPKYPFSGSKFDVSLVGMLKANNDRLLSEEAFISPFALLGVGYASYYGSQIGVGNSVFMPIGVGCKIRISPALSLRYQLIFNLNSDDKSDGKIDGKADNFLKQTFGLVLTFGNLGKTGGTASIYSHKQNLFKKLFHKK
ncbi:MAG: hypothetical protein WCJ03_01680 [Bacteroidales bacterium]